MKEISVWRPDCSERRTSSSLRVMRGLFVESVETLLHLTMRWSQPPLALSVPLSRFTSRVGGGSAWSLGIMRIFRPKRFRLVIAGIIGAYVITALVGIPAVHRRVRLEAEEYHKRVPDVSPLVWFHYTLPVL